MIWCQFTNSTSLGAMTADRVAWSIHRCHARERTWDERLFTQVVRRRHLALGGILGVAVAILRLDTHFLLGVILVAMALDFWREIVLARVRFKEQLVKLEIIFASPRLSEQWYLDQDARLIENDRVNTFADWQSCLGSPYQLDVPLASILPTALLHKLWLSAYIGHRITGYRVVDFGCHNGLAAAYFQGGREALPHDANYEPNSIANHVIGVDIMQLHARRVWRGLGIPSVVASVTAVPLAAGQFDVVSMCEILEHLHSPIDSLREASRVLKPGGRLILTTPNRHGLQIDHWVNPFIVGMHLLTLLGLELLLPPAGLTYEDEGEPAYHTDFSWRELNSLLEKAGFVVVEFGTFAFFTGLHRIVGRIWPRLRLGQYAFWLHQVEAGLAKVPLIRLLGTHWFVIAQRPAEVV
ncbi:methyltransferase domain-containing protein [Acidobacteria bacterium AH-259-D05]|nr:methyltransferase domain-containing protein [Acidobacteria bacterium AH-259-D05]